MVRASGVAKGKRIKQTKVGLFEEVELWIFLRILGGWTNEILSYSTTMNPPGSAAVTESNNTTPTDILGVRVPSPRQDKCEEVVNVAIPHMSKHRIANDIITVC